MEKPSDPPATLVAIATYVYHRAHVPLIAEYLAGDNPPDAPGNLVAWLHTRRPVYGYRLGGEWFDVGDREQLLVADNWLRRRQPARSATSTRSRSVGVDLDDRVVSASRRAQPNVTVSRRSAGPRPTRP